MVRFFLILWLTLFAALSPAYAADDEAVPQFIKFPAIITNIIDGIHITGLVSVTVQVHVDNKMALRRLEQARPKLQDCFTRTVIDLAQIYIDPYRPLPWSIMTRELQHAADIAMPKEKMRVLVVDASTRPT